MEQALPWITLGVQIVAFIFLYLHQKSIIKSQKAAIESMQAYHQIFDPNKVKGYVDILSNKHEAEVDALKRGMEEKLRTIVPEQLKEAATNMSTDLAKKISDEYQQKVDELIDHYEKRDEVIRTRYWEFIQVVASIINTVEESDRERFVKENFPVNEELLLEVLNMEELFPPKDKKSKPPVP